MAAEVAATMAEVTESRTPGSTSQDHSTQQHDDADAIVAKQDVINASQRSSSPVQSSQHREEPESVTVSMGMMIAYDQVTRLIWGIAHVHGMLN